MMHLISALNLIGISGMIFTLLLFRKLTISARIRDWGETASNLKVSFLDAAFFIISFPLLLLKMI